MPRNSSGVYSLPASDVNPAVSNTTIDPAAWTAQQVDIASEVTNSLDRLGRGTMLAPLNMGANNITNAGAPVAQTDVARLTDISAYLPAGVILPWAGGIVAPTGWLLCNGAAVSRTTYATLFTAIGTQWGTGDGSTTFNVPDFRGSFIRGLDSGKGLDPSRVFATFQADMFASHTHVQNAHTHGITDPTHFHQSSSVGGLGAGSGPLGLNPTNTSAAATGITVNAATAVNQTTGSAETAPKNYAVPFIIRT